MRGLVKVVFAMALVLGAQACDRPARALDPAAVEAAGPDHIPLIDEAVNVACDASYQFTCGAAGCVRDGDALPSVPLAWSFDGATGQAQLCMATGCVPAFLTALPAEEAASTDALTGAILTMPNPDLVAQWHEGEGPFFDGVVTIARDQTSFQIVRTGASQVTVWGGACGSNGRN